MNFERIKYYYDTGLWNKLMVRIAVHRGIITKEQFKEIVGEEY